MSQRSREEERHRLTQQINEWNANRLDLFELNQPDEVKLHNYRKLKTLCII